MTITWGKLHKGYFSHHSLKLAWKHRYLRFKQNLSKGQWVDKKAVEMVWHVHALKGLIHLDLNTMTAILQTAFSNAFSWIEIVSFWSIFHWILFLTVELILYHHWFRLYIGTDKTYHQWFRQRLVAWSVQIIIWTNAEILLIGPLGTNFS